MTDDEFRSLEWAYRDKGDLTRSSLWLEKQDEIKREFPELVDAQQRLVSAQRTLAAVMAAVAENFE